MSGEQIHVDFSDESKAAFEKAEEKAKELGHPYVGIEHLLFGLLAIKADNQLLQEIASLAGNIIGAKESIEFLLRHEPIKDTANEGLTERLQTVITLATQVAYSESTNIITPMHLTKGIVLESKINADEAFDSLLKRMSALRSELPDVDETVKKAKEVLERLRKTHD